LVDPRASLIPPSIHTAKASDAEELAALVNSAYRGESSRAGWTTEADLVGGTRTDAAQLREEMKLPNGRFEILRDGEGKLLACVFLVREAPDTLGRAEGIMRNAGVSGASLEAPVCYLGMLTVRPAEQAGGVGKRFLAHAEKVARDWGCARIRMTVIDRRPELIAYYERRGYTRTGIVVPFHFDDPRFGLPKVELNMVELAKSI
jgi:GNAT superfamily N-acetyltransferase